MQQIASRNEAATPGVILVLAFGCVGAFFSQDSGVFLFSIVLFVFFVKLFTSKNAPPVIFFSFVFQWLFYSAQLLDGLFRGKDVNSLGYNTQTRDDVILIGLVATFAFFIGVFWVVRKIPTLNHSTFTRFFLKIDLKRFFLVYICFDFFIVAAGALIWALPAIVQPLYVFTLFRWSLFFLLLTTVFVQRRSIGFFGLVVLFDFFLAFFSFFANFKDVLFFSFIGFWIFFFRTSWAARFALAALFALTILIGAVWTAIKEDYREFVNRGTEKQAVLVSRGEAYGKLLDLVSEVNSKQMTRAFEVLVDRVSWIGAFDGVYRYVPKRRGHENGKLWLEGLSRPFMPRILFPDKKPLEDSKELNYYSGLNVSEDNTSISLSMVAGTYVDFGQYTMHLVLFVFGVFAGWIVLKAFSWSGNVYIGYALTMPTVFLFHISEESINRVISSLILYFLVLWVIKIFLLKPFLSYININQK